MERPAIEPRRRKDLILPIATNIGDVGLSLPRNGVAAQRNEPKATAELILSSLEESKAEDIVEIDISAKSSIADYMIVASGRSHRHVGAIADQLLRDLKTAGYGSARVEGLPHCDWVLADVGDVVVHIFRPEVRDFYNIEKMWSAAKPDHTVPAG